MADLDQVREVSSDGKSGQGSDLWTGDRQAAWSCPQKIPSPEPDNLPKDVLPVYTGMAGEDYKNTPADLATSIGAASTMGQGFESANHNLREALADAYINGMRSESGELLKGPQAALAFVGALNNHENARSHNLEVKLYNGSSGLEAVIRHRSTQLPISKPQQIPLCIDS